MSKAAVPGRHHHPSRTPLFKELGAVLVSGLPLWGLDLYSAAARARPIRGFAPLRDDALEAEAHALRQQVIGVWKGLAGSNDIALGAF